MAHAEPDAADGTRPFVPRDMRTAFGTRDCHGRVGCESNATRAFPRLFRDKPSAGWTLVEVEGDLLLPTAVLRRRRGDVVDPLQVLDDLRQAAYLRIGLGVWRGRPATRGRTPGSVRTSCAPGERRPAELTLVELERGELAALPAEDSRHRAHLGQEFVDFSAAAKLDATGPLRDRPNHTPGVGCASRFPPIRRWSRLASYDNQDRVRARTPCRAEAVRRRE